MELRDRLRHALRSETGPRRPATRRAADIEAMLGLRRVETPQGAVYVGEQSWPIDHQHGSLPLADALALPDPALSRLAPRLRSDELADAAYVDVETTGLAGGTGTYVFLVGIGAFDRDSFTLRQFFLAGLPGEPAMLAAVSSALAGHRALVSFNGRNFDMPLLGTRLTLSRLPSPPAVPHLDLLYPARRLYRRRLPSCRLGVLEESILGLEREDDVPGWLVPSLYIDYIRTGRAGPLRNVFHHNALDILSLVTLLAHLGHLAGGTRSARAEDYAALGRWDEAEGRLWEAASMYARALEAGLVGESAALARMRLAYLYRRLDRLEDAAALWREQARSRGPLETKLRALVELAKLDEHRRRDYAAAETLTQRALSLLEVAELRGIPWLPPDLRREALEHRLRRVRRRLASVKAAGDT